jgi:hypothetical protein
MTAAEILTLARAYAALTGVPLSRVGLMSCGNPKIYGRLAQGRGANVLSVERAASWFSDNWPDAPWPAEVPRPTCAPAE